MLFQSKKLSEVNDFLSKIITFYVLVSLDDISRQKEKRALSKNGLEK